MKDNSIKTLYRVFGVSRRLLGILWREDKRTFIESLIAVIVPGIIPFINAYIYAQIINFVIMVVNCHPHSYTHLYLLIFLRILMLFIQDAAFTAQQRNNVIFSTKIPLIFSQAVINQLSRLDMSMIEDSDFQNKFNSAKDSAAWRPYNVLNNIKLFNRKRICCWLYVKGKYFMNQWKRFCFYITNRSIGRSFRA